MTKAISRETGKDRMSIKMESMISKGRFRKGSLTMDAGIECPLTADNYLSIKKRK